jgi:hypothetical protein
VDIQKWYFIVRSTNKGEVISTHRSNLAPRAKKMKCVNTRKRTVLGLRIIKNVYVTFCSNCLARLYKLLRQQAILARLSIRDLVD